MSVAWCQYEEDERISIQGFFAMWRNNGQKYQILFWKPSPWSVVRGFNPKVGFCSSWQERDGMRAILESYDSELTPSEHSPQLNRRMREAEEMVQKLHAHNTELEVIKNHHALTPGVK